MPEQNSGHRRLTMLPLMAATGLCIAVLVTALYRIGAGQSNAMSGECAASRDVAAEMAPLAQGEVAAVTVSTAPEPAPPLQFEGPDGTNKALTDFRGRAVLLNIWATWCVPCRQEMPALDRLQAQLGGSDFEVVAVNVDTTRLQNRRPFLEAAGVHALQFYADPSGDAFQALRLAGKSVGLPTSLLIDKTGCVLSSIAGPADWASPDAIRLVKALLKR
jgi:thiol-disulfide isomerase/thioredoxin